MWIGSGLAEGAEGRSNPLAHGHKTSAASGPDARDHRCRPRGGGWDSPPREDSHSSHGPPPSAWFQQQNLIRVRVMAVTKVETSTFHPGSGDLRPWVSGGGDLRRLGRVVAYHWTNERTIPVSSVRRSRRGLT